MGAATKAEAPSQEECEKSWQHPVELEGEYFPAWPAPATLPLQF